MLQKFLDKLAELIAEKVAIKLSVAIQAQIAALEHDATTDAEQLAAAVVGKLEQLPQQILSALNPFKGQH